MENIQKNQKTILKALLFLMVLSLSCKKSDTNFNVINWETKKIEIANKVKANLDSVKLLLPYAISKAENGNVLFNNQRVNEYYGVSHTVPNKIVTISQPKNIQEITAGIKTQQLSALPDEGNNPGNPIDEDDPMLRITEEAYRTYYWEATQNFTDLASYITALDGIASTMLGDFGVTEEKKVMMYTEIETLKQYATDLETNPDYWINLYAPTITGSTSNAGSVLASKTQSTTMGFNMDRLMSRPDQSSGCKINTRGVLMGAVIGGFTAAIGYAKIGAVAGTVTVPGVGTVTGAVSGFMSGFAAGFVGGVVTGVIGELMTSCFRK